MAAAPSNMLPADAAPNLSRRSSVSSDTSDLQATPAHALLKPQPQELPIEFASDGSINLEHFFRTCADTLARQGRGGPHSRATTFVIDRPRRAATLDFEPKSPPAARNPRSPDPPDPNDVFPAENEASRSTEALNMDQLDEWQARQADWHSFLKQLPDVWKATFPDCQHGLSSADARLPHCTCHPLSHAITRMQAQRDVILARICLEHDSSSLERPARFLPWLSLIGYKLGQIHTFSRAFAFDAFHDIIPKPDSIRNDLLTCILRYFNDGPSHYLARHKEFCIGWMLEFCYRRGNLTRPKDLGDPVLEGNFRNLIHALWCLNIIQTPRYRLTFTYDWNEVQQRLPVMGIYSLDLRPKTAVEKSFEEIERRLQESPPNLTQSQGENVRCMDLNIRSLGKIGGLKIVWTTCDRDHLFLDQESGVLRVGWFNRVLVPEFYKYMPMLGRNDVYRTWEMLLGHRKHKHDFTDLDKIAMPSELSAFNELGMRRGLLHRRQNSRELQHDPLQVPDIYDKYDSLPNLPRSVPYSYFGAYEARVRTLRHYMDTRKPTGFKNLWHDRRDTLSYYTFWAVIIFGGLSVLLGILGLAASILQAYASFKAIPST